MDKDSVYEELRFLVRAGLTTKKDVFDLIALRCRQAEALHAEEPRLRGFAAKLLNRREQEEATWTDRGTNDELDAAFAALNACGIVALQNAGWTQTMGWEDAWGEYEARKARGRAPRGAVFYHAQDTERGLEGDGLYLGFGAFAQEDNDPGGVAVAAEVCQVLARHGIAYEWGGTQEQRIRLLPFPWRRRMFTTAPAASPRPAGWRRLRHPDGRAWSVRTVGPRVEIELVMDDGEALSRKQQAATEEAAAARAAQLIAEQLSDGFVEEA